MMTSRKFWFCFNFPAVLCIASLFPAEVGLRHQLRKSDDDETDFDTSDNDDDSDDEAAGGSGDAADDMQIPSVAHHFKAAAAAGTATSSIQLSASQKTRFKAASENHQSIVLIFASRTVRRGR
jgi:hypothetical protein